MTLLKKASLIFFGALGCSSLSNYILLEQFGLPIFLPELFVFPLLLIFRKEIGRLVVSSSGKKIKSYAVTAVFLIVIFSIYSSFFNELGLYGAFATARGYLYLILTAIVSFRLRSINLQVVFLVCLGSALGSLVTAQVIWFDAAYGMGARIYPNMPALFLLVAIPLVQRKPFWILVALFLGLAATLESGVRRPFIPISAALLGVSFVFVLKARISFFRRFSLALVVIGVSFVGFVFLEPLAGMVGINEYQRTRVLERTSALLLEGELDRSDSFRLRTAQDTLSSWDSYLWPKGFLAKNTAITGRGRYTDFPVYELFYTFSFWGVLVIFLSFVFFGTNRLISEACTRVLSFDTVVAASVFLFPSLIVISGTFLYFTYEVPFSGLILGRFFVGKQRMFLITAGHARYRRRAFDALSTRHIGNAP